MKSMYTQDNVWRLFVSVALIALAIAAGCNQSGVPAAKNDAQTGTTDQVVQQVPQTEAQGQTQTQVPATPVQSSEPVVQAPTQTTPVQSTGRQTTTQGTATTRQRTRQQQPPPVTSEPHAQTTPAVPAVAEVTVAAGTTLSGSVQTPVSTTDSKVGDKVVVRLEEPVVVGGVTVFPVGSTVQGAVTQVASAGRLHGGSDLVLQFDTVVVPNGKTVPVACTPVSMHVDGDGKQTAAEIGGGAVAGGVLGRVLGGKKSTLKGAAIGAAVGTGVAAVKKGEQIVLPVGSAISVTLSAPVVVGAGSTL